MAHELEQSRLERAGEYERVQKKAFTNWVNSHLIKAGMKVTDINEDFKDGIKLLVLLELLTGQKLPREKGKMRVHKLQNVQNALDYLQKVKKIKLVNIRNDEIVDGNPKLILGLLWTLILHFQISESLIDDDQPRSSPQEISTKAIKEQLLQWAKMATDGYEGVSVNNFHSSWRDGLAFNAIIDRYRPDLLDYEDCAAGKPLENLERAFKVAEEKLEIVRIVDPEDVNVPKPDDKAIMTYVSFLHQAFPEMPPPARKIRGPDVSPADYSELYDNLKSWIDKTTEIAENRDFPNSVEKLKKGIDKLERIRSRELPTRKQDVATLSEMQDKIEAHKRKHSSAGVPADKDLAQLKNDWDTMEKELEKCEEALMEKLKRLEDLDALARRLNAECDSRKPAVDELEKRVEELEGSSSAMSSAEVDRAVSDLTQEIQQQLAAVGGLQPGVDTLKDGKHPDAAAIQERINCLTSKLESLGPQLEKVSSSASEAEEVAAMENNLEALEAWLVSSGKFSSNQHILRQIQAHRTFQMDQLSKAEKDFTRMSNSPPPPGMEEKVKEVNERFQRVVKQTEDRLAGLEPIVDEVLEFEELKNSLGNWCIAEQETIDQLPLLEVTEVKLLEQQQECHTLLEDIMAQSDSLQKLEDIATQFLRHTEPVQSIADQYARKLKTKVRQRSESHEEPSLGEQAGIIQSQFDWLKGCMTERDSQISSLLEKLHQFNLQYDDLQKFVREGNDLLAQEKPVGADAARVQEQMDTCQDFRAQIAEKQPLVDTMLSLGREILAEPNTSSASEALMQKLTKFIQDWSDLQLNWQNWFDELHAGVEQSRSLSDQLKKFESDMRGLGPACARLFPATISMKNLDKELQRLQGKFTSEVWKPYEAQKAVYEMLKAGSSLLPSESAAEEIFKNFEDLSSTIEGHHQELNEVVEEVGQWWAGCEGISQWLGETEGRVIAHKPLASSLDIIDQQKQSVQELVEGVESHRGDFERSMKALEQLSQHNQLLESAPVDSFKAVLDRRWKALGKEIDSRIELSRCAKDHLFSYANDALPFATWLKGVESRIADMNTLPRAKDLLLLEKDEMKAFTDKVKVEGENLTQMEIKGSGFLGSAKTYQSQLLAYQRRVDPDRVASLPKDFVDLRTEDLTTPTVDTDDFEGDRYQNGIRVVTGNSSSLRRRYDALNARVKQHQQVVEEAVARRKEFDGCLEAFLDPLAELEAKCDGVVMNGESAPLKVEEKVEAVRTLEVECLALEPKLQDAQAKYELLSDLCQEDEGVTWEGDDEALAEKEDAEKRHHDLLEKLRKQKEVLTDELSNAQAFHGGFENFLTWLRKTERKVQRDDPLKLEEEDLKAGLKNLKDPAADIEAHKPMYEAMCAKCKELIARGFQDGEELQEKLDNLQQRWNAIQFVSDDIEVIEETIPKLEAFHSSYAGLTSNLDNLLNRIDGFSVSAISSEALASKGNGLQDFCGAIERERAGFDQLFEFCGLLETPFDQSQFESDVSAMNDKMKQCEKRVSDKKSELKALDRKVRPMEDMFAKFRSWLEESKTGLSALSPAPSLAQEAEREKAIKQAQYLLDDIGVHHGSLERLEAAVNAVLPLLDEPDQEQLKAQLDDVTSQYKSHLFDSEAYLAERWLEGKEAELTAMSLTAVQPPLLQDQIREVQDLQAHVAKYHPNMQHLSSLADSADPAGAASPSAANKGLQERYERLKALSEERHALLADYLPSVQQYESSRGAWQDLLCGWEEKAEQLPPPLATPTNIQAQLQDIKAMQQDITDHEPEFVSLKRGVQELCCGPDAESAYNDKTSKLDKEGCPVGRDLPRPGQKEQDAIIVDYDRRLEVLKDKLAAQSADLSTQLEKGKAFESLTSDLFGWLDEMEGRLDDFKIRDPKSGVLKAQQQNCQSLLDDMAGKAEDKDKLAPFLTDLTSRLPEGTAEQEELQNQLDDVAKRWGDLSNQLEQHKANLDSAFGLACSHEGSMKMLTPWVPQTLEHLENLGPPPAEPEKVQNLRAEIEGLKVEYNSLAPAYASCVENGQSLAGMCEKGEPLSILEGDITDLQDKWERLSKLFGDLNEKLTAALVQTQEFQGIAEGLENWMSGMDDQLRQQDRIAARCKLIEPQIEGFKPILSDIETYSSTLDQATSIGQSLIAESNEEEKLKIESKLSSMAEHFSKLRENSQKRMSRLKAALKMATTYEDQSDGFDRWLQGIEAQRSSMQPFTIASQPLKAQLERLQEFSQDVESHAADLDSVTRSEEELFDTEMSSIEQCEEHLKPDSTASSILPDWFDRPGAPEAVGVGADLRNRYSKLGLALGAKRTEGAELLEKVLGYEAEHDKFKEWLLAEKGRVGSLAPLAITSSEIRQQLKETEDIRRDFRNQESNLESVNTHGTELIEGCKDELSGASGRLKLSDLNDLWGDTLSAVTEREEKLKEGLVLADNFQSLHDGFDGWLSGCEDQVSTPVRLEGNPAEIARQLKDLKVLSEDIAEHHPQMDDVITAGHALEDYSNANSSMLPDIGYMALEDRYKALQQKVGERVSALEDTLGQVSSLRDQLDGLLEKLLKMKSGLKGHEPPHVTPADVEKQIKELMLLDKAYGELVPAISKCKEEGRSFTSAAKSTASSNEGIPSGTDIQQLLSAIDGASADVQGLLDHWRDLLASSLETAKKLENDSKSMSTWIQDQGEELAAADMVRGFPEEVRKQIAEVEAVQAAISEQQPKMEALSILSHSMANNCSHEDSLLLGEKQAQLVSAFESLQRSAVGRKRHLEDGLAQAVSFASSWADAMEEIEAKRRELEHFETVGVDIDTVKAQLVEYKEFESSLSDLKAKILSTLSEGKKLKDSCSPVDGLYLRDQMDQLNAAWSQLHSDGLGRKHNLEDALLRLGQFHDALGELLMWIDNCTGRLTEAREPGVEPSAVEGQIQDLQNIESGIASHAPSVVSLNMAGGKLLSSSSAENTAEIQRDLADLNKRWDTLQALASKRKGALEDAMEKASDFNTSWKEEVGWLSEAERRAYADWKPSGLPETCKADIHKHKAFVDEVKSHEAQIEAVKAKGNALKSQGTPEDKKMVERWVGDLVKRYDDLSFTLDEKNAQLMDAKARADKCDGLYLALKEKMAAQEQEQASQEPIQSEVGAVRRQMEEHKEHLQALLELEADLEKFNGWGQLLIKDCVTPDGEVIQQRIDDLKVRCDALSSAGHERETALEESLLSLGQFEGAYDDLWAWLAGAMKKLEEFEPITGDPDAVAVQLAKHKTLQKQLGARLSSKDAVVKAGKQLMKHKTGEAKEMLKKKLQGLEKEWEKVCQVSVDRQDRLEDAYSKIGEFRSHVAPLQSWMHKVLPSLSKSEPVHGDLGTVEALIDAHNAFQKDIGSHQQSVDSANECGDHLISDILDDPAVTKDDQQQLNENWDELCQQSVDKQDRLDEAQKAAESFERDLTELVSWIDTQAKQLVSQADPAEDVNALQQQIDENKALVQEVAARKPGYDSVCSDGQNILRLAHPQAVGILDNKLQQLERKWRDLRNRLGDRSEGLASAQLELHGLQGMLESLQAWVAEADSRMTETEATPIATDIETVERQLANHEAFQEEMVAQQPNMDALNKKRKITNPHTNPQMNKKIASLHKRWQKLWFRSNERHRQLLDARTRLKDIALARSFNFDNWKKRFTTWVDQQKLRVNDLFRRFDSNHDGMLTREEFMKALKASGLAMNQIELEKIADTFDKDRSGMIDLSEIISVLKGSNRRTRRPVLQEAQTAAQKIDTEIELQISQCTCEKRFNVTRVAEGQYRFGDNQKLRLVRILRSSVMVRVGGGWEPLEEFLRKHDPCRAAGRTNVEIKSMIQQRGPGLATYRAPPHHHGAEAPPHHHHGAETSPHHHGAENGHHHHAPATARSFAPNKHRATKETSPLADTPKYKSASLTRKTPPRGLTPPRGTTGTTQARSSTPVSRKPNAGLSTSAQARSATPTGQTARSSTPVSGRGGATGHGRSLTPVSGSKTPVSGSKTAGARRGVSPQSGASPTKVPANSTTKASSASTTGSSSGSTAKVSRIPTLSKIPTPTSSKTKIPTEHP